MIVPVHRMVSAADFTGQTCRQETFPSGRYPAYGIDVLLFDYGALGRVNNEQCIAPGRGKRHSLAIQTATEPT